MGGRGSSFSGTKASKKKDFPKDLSEFYSGSDIDKFFGTNTGGDNDDWYDSLSKQERGLIIGYTGSDYKEMNEYLRNMGFYDNKDGGGFYAAKMKAKTGDLQNAITKSPLKQSIKVHRYDNGGLLGISNINDLKNIEIGKTVTTKGFLSTSMTRQTGFGNIGYDITIRQGSKAGQYIGGMSKYHSEYEFLVKHGAKLKITGFTKHQGKAIVQMEYIG